METVVDRRRLRQGANVSYKEDSYLSLSDSEDEQAKKPKRSRHSHTQVHEIPKDQLHSHLFNELCTLEPSSLQNLSLDQLESYKQNPLDYTKDLVILALRSCACTIAINATEVEDSEASPSIINHIAEQLHGNILMDAPFNSPRDSDHKKFLSNFPAFMTLLVRHSHEMGLLYDTELLKNWCNWYYALSDSKLRAFRLCATTALFAMMTEIASLITQLEDDLVHMARRKVKPDTVLIQTQISSLTTALHDFISSVLTHRYRDVEPRVRQVSLDGLTQCIRVCPNIFLTDKYLRTYIWLLFDSDTKTRLKSIKSLLTIYKDPRLKQGLTYLIERFSDRIAKVAVLDHDKSARITALDLIALCTQDDHPRAKDQAPACVKCLLYDPVKPVRLAAAKLALDVTNSEIKSVSHNHLENETCARNFKDWVRLKLLCDLLAGADSLDEEDPQVSNRSLFPTIVGTSKYIESNRRLLSCLALCEAAMGTIQASPIIDYLEFDFSSTTLSDEERKLIWTENAPIAIDILCAIASTHTDSTRELVCPQIPNLLSKYAHSPTSTAKLIELFLLVQPNGLDTTREEELARQTILNTCQSLISSQTSQPDSVLDACVRLFSSCLDSALRTQVLQISQTFVSAICDPNLIVDNLQHLVIPLELLGRVVDLEPLGTEWETTFEKLAKWALTLHEDTHTIWTAVRFTRSCLIWKIGKNLSSRGEQSSLSMINCGMEVLDHVILDPRFNNTRALKLGIEAIIDVHIAIKAASSTVPEGSSAYRILCRLSDIVPGLAQCRAVSLFIYLEKMYADVRGISLENDPGTWRDSFSQDDLSECDKISAESSQDNASTIETPRRALELNIELCSFAARLRLASLFGVIEPSIIERLLLNARNLSPTFNEAIHFKIQKPKPKDLLPETTSYIAREESPLTPLPVRSSSVSAMTPVQ